jgi:hypothetical protein
LKRQPFERHQALTNSKTGIADMKKNLTDVQFQSALADLAALMPKVSHVNLETTTFMGAVKARQEAARGSGGNENSNKGKKRKKAAQADVES